MTADGPPLKLDDSGSASDLELWTRTQNGDGDAFGVLFDRYSRAVYNYCFRRTANWATAQDLTSTVFLECWRRREIALTTDSALPWLLGIATNGLRNHHRGARRQKAALERLHPPEPTPDFVDDSIGRLDDQVALKAVNASLRHLTRGERDVLTLIVWTGLSYEQTAAALNLPLGTVRSRLSRARAKLQRNSWEDPGTSPPPRTQHQQSPRPGGRNGRELIGMELPAERNLPKPFEESLREQIMTTARLTAGLASAPRRAIRRPRRRLAIGATLVLTLVIGGGAAAAATSAVHRQSNGVVVVDSQRLTIVYNGHLIDQAQLLKLNKQHKAMFYAGDVTSAEQGHGHAFDTMAELDAYSQQLLKHDK